ncbi:hypothetical protein C0995_016032 [Termitomyces sp. Mi166|nr:hypothetical protein C0995_016032 [Termitomyces sp. Mi166\
MRKVSLFVYLLENKPYLCLTEIGVALTTFGGLFMLLGVMLFFDGALLALGNVLFISGVTLIIGPQKTFYFFARKQKIRGTICFLGGVLLVFFKWPFLGVIVETFGFLNLFGWWIVWLDRELPQCDPITCIFTYPQCHRRPHFLENWEPRGFLWRINDLKD